MSHGFCDHCGVRAKRRWCYPCRKTRTIYGEAGLERIQTVTDAGSWRKQLTRWRANDPAFADYYYRGLATVTLTAGEVVVDELQRAKRRRASFAIVKAFARSECHRGITRRLALGRAALATGNWCHQGKSDVISMRAWRAGIAHWLRFRHGAGDGRPPRCRDTIEAITGAVVRCERAIEWLLVDVERRARRRVRESRRMGNL